MSQKNTTLVGGSLLNLTGIIVGFFCLLVPQLAHAADTFSARTSMPAAADSGFDMIRNGTEDYIYAERGGSSNFYRYSISGNAWTTLSSTPGATFSGATLLRADNEPYIYLTQGLSTGFYRYNITTGTWSTLTAVPSAVYSDNNVNMLRSGTENFIYLIPGNSTSTFYRYSISGNSWTNLAPTPKSISNEGGLTLLRSPSEDYIYLAAGNTTTFFRYSISGDSWTTLTASPGTRGIGSTAIRYGTENYIYLSAAGYGGTFYRYSISGDSWTTLATIPINVYQARTTLARISNQIYAFGDGFGTAFARYNILTDTWSSLNAVGTATGWGGKIIRNAGERDLYVMPGGAVNFYRYSATNTAPMVAMAATSSPGAPNGNTTTLAVLGDDDLSESLLTYTWSILSKPSGASNPTFSTNTTNAASTTVATFPATTGTYRFLVTITDQDGLTATSTATTTINSVNSAPTLVSAATSTPATINSTTTTLSVRGTDDGGANLLTYTWSVSSKPVGANDPTFSTNTTNFSSSTVATFSKAGTYQFAVTIADTGSYTVVSYATTTVNQVTTTVTVTPSSALLEVNSSTPFTATSTDQFGAAMTPASTFVWSVSGVGSVNATSGFFTAGVVIGTSTITATAGSVSGTSSVSVTAINTAPTIVTAPSSSPAITSGTTSTLFTLGTDDNGESNLTYTWSVISKPVGATDPTFSTNTVHNASTTLATFSKAGTYQFKVIITDSGNLTVSSTVTTTVNQRVAAVIISPTSASVYVNSSTQFTATSTDQFNAAMVPSSTFVWSVTGSGSINSGSGLYTGSAATGTASVIATASGVSNSVAVTITTLPVVDLSPMPIISSNVPAYASNTASGYSASNANNPDIYDVFDNHSWISSTTPSWLAYDLSGVAASQRGVVDILWLNNTNAYPYNLGFPTVSGIPRNYTIEANAAAGGGSAPTTGWVTLTTVVDNDYHSRQHVVDLTGYNWVRLNVSSVRGGTQVKIMHMDVFDLSQSGGVPQDSWMFYGDSITLGSMDFMGYFFQSYNSTTFSYIINRSEPSYFPAQENGGFVGAYTEDAITNIDTWLAIFPGKYVALSYGTNDSGVISTSTYYSNYTTLVTKVIQAGKTPIIPKIPWGKTASVQTNVPNFNAVIDQLYIDFPQVVHGPDFWTYFLNNQSLINNADVHPTSDGYTNMKTLWAETMLTNVYAYANASPTVTTTASSSPRTITGTTTTLFTLGSDDDGASGLSYTWSVNSKPVGATDPTFSLNGTNAASTTMATFSSAGTYQFKVVISDTSGLSATSYTTTTVNQRANAVVVSVATTTIQTSSTTLFTASSTDQFGVDMTSSTTFTWSKTGVGTINATSGLFSAGISSGTSTIFASASTATGTSNITVTSGNAAPTISTTATSTPSTVTNTSTLSVLGADDAGENNLTYIWAVAAKPVGATDPTFSLNGTNAASTTLATFSKAGTYQFSVTITDTGSLTVTSYTTTTVSQLVSTVAVSPITTSTLINSVVQFTATSSDQFGAEMSPSSTFTWSVTGSGSINATSGLYTAGSNSGSATVTALVSNASNSASITITGGSSGRATAGSNSPALVGSSESVAIPVPSNTPTITPITVPTTILPPPPVASTVPTPSNTETESTPTPTTVITPSPAIELTRVPLQPLKQSDALAFSYNYTNKTTKTQTITVSRSLISPQKTTVSKSTATVRLAANQSFNRAVIEKIPTTMPSGIYTMRIVITDAAGSHEEAFPITVTSPITFDQIPEQPVARGNVFAFEYAYQNTTTKTQQAYVQRKIIAPTKKTVFTSTALTTIQPKQTFVRNITQTLPKNLAKGTYTIMVTVRTNQKVLAENTFTITLN